MFANFIYIINLILYMKLVEYFSNWIIKDYTKILDNREYNIIQYKSRKKRYINNLYLNIIYLIKVKYYSII